MSDTRNGMTPATVREAIRRDERSGPLAVVWAICDANLDVCWHDDMRCSVYWTKEAAERELALAQSLHPEASAGLSVRQTVLGIPKKGPA